MDIITIIPKPETFVGGVISVSSTQHA